ncbi:MAG: discoidin domain-containing protein, partial [Oscillospiraceae bacterium]|nr:discoidin domain-containing protein [Oscillospiraceae bacterium]
MTKDTAYRRAAWASSSADYNSTAHLATQSYGEWISAGGGEEWLYVDLGVETQISRVAVQWGDTRAEDYSIGISNDAESWTDVDENAVNAAARYVRLLCLSSSGDRYKVRRLEVFGENDLDYTTDCGWYIERATAVNGEQLTDNYGTKSASAANAAFPVRARTSDHMSEISLPGYDASGWLPAVVPGTALVSYLKAGAIPDPNYDDWQFQVSESFFTADFWYRKLLTIPEARRGERVFLNFDAINWKADVYFNGKKLPNALPSREKTIEGAFIRAKLDVTELVNFGGDNIIAVLVYKNDTPGEVTTQGLAEGPGPNGGLLGADNPTLHASVGWDWLPTIRGRNTGIYGDFYVSYGAGAELIDPWIETDPDIREV